jgi:hypothetical protein
MMNGYRDSESLIVSKKPLNKIRHRRHMAERMEKRRLAKGNSSMRNKGKTQCWLTLSRELERVRQAEQSRSVRQYLKQEPSALALYAAICTAGAG